MDTNATIFAILTLIWHQKGGCQLFYHIVPRRINVIVCGSIIANGVILGLELLPWRSNHYFNALEWVVSMLVIMFYLHKSEVSQRFTFISPEKLLKSKHSMKAFELNLTLLK